MVSCRPNLAPHLGVPKEPLEARFALLGGPDLLLGPDPPRGAPRANCEANKARKDPPRRLRGAMFGRFFFAFAIMLDVFCCRFTDLLDLKPLQQSNEKPAKIDFLVVGLLAVCKKSRWRRASGPWIRRPLCLHGGARRGQDNQARPSWTY